MKHQRNPNQVYIFDTTNRDGAQATKGAKGGNPAKLEIVRMLGQTRVDRIEAGFPYSSQANFEAVQQAAREVHESMVFGLTRPRLEEVKATYEAVKDAEFPGIHVFSIMFDPNSLKAYRTTKEQVVEDCVKGIGHARKLLGGRGQVEFSFQNATNTPLENIVYGYKRAIEAGANVINVPDTVGYSQPEEITLIVKKLREEVPDDVMISIHCHNDLGLAVANSLAAVKAGADIVECAVNGIGERAGNAALEEVAMGIIVRKDFFDGKTIRLDTQKFGQLSRLVSDVYSMVVQENKAIVGANAFRHRSGIHQDGMLQRGGLYEIMRSEQVGWIGEGIELNANSGWVGVSYRIQRLGYAIKDGDKASVMSAFKTSADERPTVEDADLVYIMDTINGHGKGGYRFVDMSAKTETGSRGYISTIILESLNGQRFTATSNANELNGIPQNKDSVIEHKYHGPVETICAAIKKIEGNPNNLHLVKYDPINIGSGEDAPAEVTVILSKQPEFDGRIRPFDGMYVGRARHADTLRASGMAYLDALNKARQ